jgi:hypothetical protein
VTIRHRLAVAAVATAGLFACCVPASAAPAGAPATSTDPAAAAAGWLAQQFVAGSHVPSPAGDHFEGSFGSPVTYFFDGGTTADAIYALAAAKAGKSKIDAALAYFEKHVAEYTSVNDTSGTPGPSDGQVAKTALAAIVGGADPTSFGGYNLLKALKDDECTEKSGSKTDFTIPTCPAVGAGRNIFASVSESLIILAESRAGGSFAPSAAAVDYLRSLQCSDGGFTVETSAGANCASDVDATGYAVAALIALGGQQAALDKATAWLTGERNAAGYWVAQGGPDVDSTGLAAAALDAAGKDTSSSRTWLASQQVTSGPTTGAGASRGALKFQGKFDAASSIKATADGLLGMVRGGCLATLSAAGASDGTAVLALSAPKFAAASVKQGGQQTVTGTGFGSGEKVAAELHSAPVHLDGVTASKAGTAVVHFTVPTSLAPGSHSVVLTGAKSGLTSTATFTVKAAAVAPTTTAPGAAGPTFGVSPQEVGPLDLADTGLDGRAAMQYALVGLACVLAGAGVVYLGRRRRA